MMALALERSRSNYEAEAISTSSSNWLPNRIERFSKQNRKREAQLYRAMVVDSLNNTHPELRMTGCRTAS
jgi:hypothetical protein